MHNIGRLPVVALVVSGLLWGTTIPLTKLALDWLPPAWLTAVRFAVAALLLAAVAGRRLRPALRPGVVAWGALGYGVCVVAQNAGVARTSVSHAALLVGLVPMLVALLAVLGGRGRVGSLSWAGFAVALGGVALLAADAGGVATLGGDALVFGSVVMSAAFVVVQPRLLAGRDPLAVTAVQFGAAALTALPFAGVLESAPPALPSWTALGSVAGLVLFGTLVPFALFAWAQARVAPEVAGAFLNLEPLVGALAGFVIFADPFGPPQSAGAVAVLVGLALTVLPGRRRPVPAPHADPTPDRELIPV